MLLVILFQALAEALTTSKGMVGRRLLECSDLSWSQCFHWPWPVGKKCHSIGFANDCNNIVNTFKATWDEAKKTAVDAANAAKKKAVDAANAAKDVAVSAANAAKEAVEAEFSNYKVLAEARYNALKADADNAASAATKFVKDVGDAFTELENEIRCAHHRPLS